MPTKSVENNTATDTDPNGSSFKYLILNMNLKNNKNIKHLIYSILTYSIWILILIFWFILFNFLIGKKIGFATGIPAIIFSYATVSLLRIISNKKQ
jgi:hypothetical protein